MTKINKEWHEANRMPKNPTLEQRIKWHTEHQKNCNCWPIPSKLLEEMKKKALREEGEMHFFFEVLPMWSARTVA